MISLICCAIFWVLWLISSNRIRKWFFVPLGMVAVGFIVITSPVIVNLLLWGLTVPLPDDVGDRADAIVVLGRGPDARNERLVLAWDLWESQRAPTIFSSGMMDAKIIVKDLQDNGVPDDAIAGEECSQTTEENAAFSSAILTPQGIETIILVTDPPHMWRSLLVFERFGFEVIPHTTDLNLRQLSNQEKLRIIVREYAALSRYALFQKFRHRSPQEANKPEPEVLNTISAWNCRVPRQKN